MTVKAQHTEYSAMVSRWKQCRSAAEGEHVIHEAGELYLPRLEAETDKSYNLRRSMTPFFGATWKTISGLRGMMFRKPPVIEVPPALEEAIKDIDLSGRTLQGLAQDVAIEALTVGRVGLMGDYPTEAAPGMTALDAKRLKLRAFIAMYKAESIINWRTMRVNGSTVLSMVVLTENAEIPGDDEFSIKIEERYRVLDLIEGKYRQRVFKCDENGKDVQIGDDVFPLMNNKPLEYIPFVFIGVDCIGPKVEAPPLIDLVTMNFKHYGQATSYERGCFFSGLPSLFISGHSDPDTKIYIGGSLANILPQPDAKAYFVEVQSNFEALRTNLLDKQQAMAVLGARMLESQKSGVESGEAIARRQTGEESLLSCMSQTVSMGLTLALQWLAAWEGVEGEVKVELNRDFLPASMTSQDILAILQGWQMGAPGFSDQNVYEHFKRGEMADPNVSLEEEMARIGEKAPMLTGTPLALDNSDAVNKPFVEPIDQSAHNTAMLAANDQHQAIIEKILNAVSQPQAVPVINIPATIVNIPVQPAPTINIAPAAVTVEAPITVNVPEQTQQAQAPIVLNTAGGARVIEMVRDANGKITGANVTES